MCVCNYRKARSSSYRSALCRVLSSIYAMLYLML